MRSLIKNDPVVQYVDDEELARLKRRRRFVRRFIAVGCIVLAALFLVQYMKSGRAVNHGAGPAIEWSAPSSVVTWLRWNANALGVQVRNAFYGTMPSGNWGVMIKMGLCFIVAAIFLRIPQRY